MLEALGNSVECLVCMEVMVSEIRQCVLGHSICNSCANKVNFCPLCKSDMTSTRNYKLEDVIANLKVMEAKFNTFADYKKKFNKSGPGDNHQKFPQSNRGDHQSLYRYVTNVRKFDQIQLQVWNTLTIDENTRDYCDIQIVPYIEGNELFWYKHKIDVHKKEVYWLLQCVEPKLKASKFYYEFTLSTSLSRTLKMVEFCESEEKNMEELIDAGKCIIIPFKVLNKYLREDHKIYFKLKILEVKDEHKIICRNANHCGCSVPNQNARPFVNESGVGPTFSGLPSSALHSNCFQNAFLPKMDKPAFSINQNVEQLVQSYNFQSVALHPHSLQQQLTSHLPLHELRSLTGLPSLPHNFVDGNVNRILDLSNHSIGNEVVSTNSSTNLVQNCPITEATLSSSHHDVAAPNFPCSVPSGMYRCRTYQHVTPPSSLHGLQNIPKRRKPIIINKIPDAFVDLTI